MSKLEEKIDAYMAAREDVLVARRDVVAIDVEIENARKHMVELQAVKESRSQLAHLAVRRYVEIANALPPLIHSEVAGIAGKQLTQPPNEAEAAQ